MSQGAPQRQPFEPPPWGEAREETADDNRYFALAETHGGHKLYLARAAFGIRIAGYPGGPTQLSPGTYYATVYDPHMRQYADGGYGRNRVVTAGSLADLRARVLRYEPAKTPA